MGKASHWRPAPIDPTNVIFTGGVLSTIDYTGLLQNGSANIQGLSYQATGNGGSIGTVSAGVTPEPSGLLLLATGLFAAAALTRWRTPQDS